MEAQIGRHDQNGSDIEGQRDQVCCILGMWVDLSCNFVGLDGWGINLCLMENNLFLG